LVEFNRIVGQKINTVEQPVQQLVQPVRSKQQLPPIVKITGVRTRDDRLHILKGTAHYNTYFKVKSALDNYVKTHSSVAAPLNYKKFMKIASLPDFPRFLPSALRTYAHIEYGEPITL
jgi:hypothetical protein